MVDHRKAALLAWIEGVISICWLRQRHSVKSSSGGSAVVQRSDVTIELLSLFLTANANVEPKRYNGAGTKKLRSSSGASGKRDSDFIPGTPIRNASAKKTSTGIAIADFELLRVVGTGSYGKVPRAKKRHAQAICDETLTKRNVLRQNQTQRTFRSAASPSAPPPSRTSSRCTTHFRRQTNV